MINLSPSAADGVLTRQDFLEEFTYRYRPGNHVILFGATGRGKTTLASELLSMPLMPKNDGLVITSLGPDKATAKLGKPIKAWPPPPVIFQSMVLDHKDRGVPFIRRFEPLPRKPEQFQAIRRQNSRILRWMFGRYNWTLFLTDLQVITDPGIQGLGKEVDQLILTCRKRNTSIWMDAQAPRWIPSSCRDNTQHLIIWPTRNENAIKSLGSIIGVDWKYIATLFQGMDFHDAIWVDVIEDEFYVLKMQNEGVRNNGRR